MCGVNLIIVSMSFPWCLQGLSQLWCGSEQQANNMLTKKHRAIGHTRPICICQVCSIFLSGHVQMTKCVERFIVITRHLKQVKLAVRFCVLVCGCCVAFVA